MTLANMLGGLSPWAWALEPTRGCNLRCGHCATRLWPKGERAFMSPETWDAAWQIIGKITPRCRVEMANAGEPTLHPDIVAFIARARALSPHSQIQITTNGTKIADGSLKARDLFRAGLNVLYIDTYAPRARHIALAQASGMPWYEYHKKPKGAPGAWTYLGPGLKLIVLMEPPHLWPESRKSKGRLGTFYNHLDWAAAKRFGLEPVIEPIARRCTQPFHYVSVHQEGWYELCCQDFFGETAGKLGSVHDGPDGFLRFWFGKEMQSARRHLQAKRRAAVAQCARCDITFSRSDMMGWKPDRLRTWWDGRAWQLFADDE